MIASPGMSQAVRMVCAETNHLRKTHAPRPAGYLVRLPSGWGAPLETNHMNEDDTERDHEYPSVRAAEAEQRRLGARPGCACSANGGRPVAVSGSVTACVEQWTTTYGDYLKTDHWKRLRRAALRYARNRCQVCYGTGNLHVHHRTYDRRGCELMSDLTVLCDPCHSVFHARLA